MTNNIYIFNIHSNWSIICI